MSVYFITDGEFIKISVAINPEQRLRELQTANARPLTILKVFSGDFEEEALFHKRFRHLRAYGEWFRADQEILDFLKRSDLIDTPCYVHSRFTDSLIHPWFHGIPQELLKKLIAEVSKCCEQAYRRGYQQGFSASQQHHPSDRDKVSQAICSWRFEAAYSNSPTPPGMPPWNNKIMGLDKAINRHCSEFQNASDWMSELTRGLDE